LTIPLHNTAMRRLPVGNKPITIHTNVLGLGLECIQGAVHGQIERVVNVDFVNFLRTDFSHSKSQCFRFDELAQRQPLGGGKLFGISKVRMLEGGGEDDGSSKYRAC